MHAWRERLLKIHCILAAFSPYGWVNDTVGFVVHSLLFAPYFSWKKSHANHHSWTGNLENDEVWVPSIVVDDPKRVKDTETMDKLYGSNPWYAAIGSILVMFTVGWPFYLTFNATGHKVQHGEVMSHFVPSSPIFKGLPAWKVHLSTAGIVAALFLVVNLVQLYGLWVIARVYLLPLSVVFFFLTSITFMHHTDESLPFWRDSEGWTWIRGAAMSTIDRSMGEFMDRKLHHISDTHVCHHIFSRIPFYHAREATTHIQRELGPLYRRAPSASFWDYMRDLYVNLRDCNALVKSDDKPFGLWWWTRKTATQTVKSD